MTACAVLVDLSKAFDVINHKIITDKLFRYGIKGSPVLIINLYLENRKQKVFIKSENLNFAYGRMTKRSILGPLVCPISMIWQELPFQKRF